MSVKSGSLSSTDSSPEENTLYLTPSFIRDRDEKGWKAYFSNSELMSASTLFSHMNNTEDSSHNPVSFLYDYYGMTEETRQDPPSPILSSTSNEDKDYIQSDSIDIPNQESNESPVMEMRHSFPESGKTSFSFFIGQANEATNLAKRPHSASIPLVNRGDKLLSCQSCNTSTYESQRDQKSSVFTPFQRPVFDNEKYVFILEAQTSVVQKKGEDSLTYVNKGQFYFLSFEGKPYNKLQKVKSIMHLVFGHQKDPSTELAHWRYWYNQQPNPNQRAFDIDVKACQSVDERIEEVGCNALAFTWNPNVRAKVSFRINCLSTDFSAQKGVKGIPLHLQVDTYEDLDRNADPVHRGFCQIKVFRDKGAERKNKDESKLVGKRMEKQMKNSENGQDGNTTFQMANKVTVLYSTPPMDAKPVIFVPSKEKQKSNESSSASSSPGSTNLLVQMKERENKRGFNTALSNAKEDLEHLDVYPKYKTARVLQRIEPAVTIYVRKEEEKAYNALMLDNLTLEELKESVSTKYGLPVDMIKHVFKKTKKGILVNMDDQLIERFADEDDYIISINFDNQLGHFEVIFSC
ncbi:grainyhead-like protein 2 homolog [Hydractinia symbiolongicarpus]|uniref:grainyhead-like protein 2 homolog n=1 Tax=Hydractinia symbiolongicarpus TaxID=13093 RepID=UPI00254B3F43|nr:grainyhead-like protein 2 homolog [Hydractinia symbiolongicarpus]